MPPRNSKPPKIQPFLTREQYLNLRRVLPREVRRNGCKLTMEFLSPIGAAMFSVLIRGVLVWYLASLILMAQPQPTTVKQGSTARTQGRKSAPLTPRQQKGLK